MKNPTFRESIVDPKLVPSELQRPQGVVPRTIFLRSHIHVEQTESQEKQGNNKLDRRSTATSDIL
jgi:hypothetical protein